MKKRIFSFLMALVMVCSILPLPVYAAEGDGLCEHHPEHVDCGYVQAVAGHPCSHVEAGCSADTCGYVPAQVGAPCQHQHDEACGFVAEVPEIPCNKDCAATDENGNIVHVPDCAYKAPVAGANCTHQHDDACGYVAAVEGVKCQHEHNADCGYVAEVAGVDCGFVCQDCKPQCSCQEKCNEMVNADCPVCGGEGGNPDLCGGVEPDQPVCNCQTRCAEGAVNGDCPVCSADLNGCIGTPAPVCNCQDKCNEMVNTDCPVCGGGDVSGCKGAEAPVISEAAGAVQAQINALPGLEAVQAMTMEEQKAVYDQTNAAYEAYLALTEEDRATVTGAEIFETLFTYFNTLTMTLPETCPFTITKTEGGEVADTDYTWDDTANKLTIKTNGLTVANTDPATNASAVIVVENTATTLTLAGVNITAPGSGGALNTTGTLTITLADGSNNTLTGGTGSSSSSYGIYAGKLSISGSGTLHAVGGAVSDPYSYSAGIFSATSIIIDGGTVEAAGGSSSSNSYGIYAYAGEGTASITINGGTVTATGNSCGICSYSNGSNGSITITGGNVTATGGSDSNKAGIGGNATFSTGDNGKAIIHASSISDNDDKSGWKGIIFEGRTTASGYDGQVYGDQTLTEDFTVNGGEVLTIPVGTTLTLSDNMTLTNEGIINNNGIIDVTNGNLAGEPVEGSGKIISSDGVIVGPFLVKGGDHSEDYTWDAENSALTINNDTPLTISTPKHTANGPAPACITAKNTGSESSFTYNDLNLTLNGVHITAQDGNSDLGSNDFNTAVLRGGKIDLTLKGSNTLTGGDTTNESSRGIYATGELEISGTGTLKANGGAVNDSVGGKDSAGIHSETSITIAGGTVVATGGSSTGSNGMSYGIYAEAAQGNASITIENGTVTAIGGSAAAASCGMSADGAITINGGSVEATGGTVTDTSNTNRQSYGIRSGSDNITITGGTGTAKTTETSATNKGAMNMEPSPGGNLFFTDAWNSTEVNWAPIISIENATVTVTGSTTYTGSALTPALTVICGETTLTPDVDYRVDYTNNTNAGEASFTVIGKGRYSGKRTGTFTIEKADSNLPLTVNQEGKFTYGDTITVEFTPKIQTQARMAAPTINQAALFLGATQLADPVNADADGKFTLTYDTANKGIPIGEHKLTVKYGGSDNLNDGRAELTVTVAPAPLTGLTIPQKKVFYTGEAITFALTVTPEGAAYDVEWKDNIDPGTATVTVTGTGNYSGTLVETFQIVKAAATIDDKPYETVQDAIDDAKPDDKISIEEDTNEDITIDKDVTFTGPGTIGGDVTITEDGKLDGGSFTGKVENNGEITGGEFAGDVENNGTISGGEFDGDVENSGTITGGDFQGSVQEKTVTVKFDSNGGSAVASQTVDSGKKLTKPKDPTLAKHSFKGWFTDEACTKAYDFDTPVTGNLTLHAKWAEVFTYTLDYKDNTTDSVWNMPDDVTTTSERTDMTFRLSSKKPRRSGYTFDGWNTQSNGKGKWYDPGDDVPGVKDGTVTLYARWEKNTSSWWDNPKTGDYIMGAVAVLAVSGIALAGLLVYSRKKKK